MILCTLLPCLLGLWCQWHSVPSHKKTVSNTFNMQAICIDTTKHALLYFHDHCIMHHVYSQILEVYASTVQQNFFHIDPINLTNVSQTQLFHSDPSKVLLACLLCTLAANFLFPFLFAFSSLTMHLLLVQLYMSSFSSPIQWHHFELL